MKQGKKKKKKKIKRDLDSVNMFFVPRINRGGGLALTGGVRLM